jgi:hypothetical protein
MGASAWDDRIAFEHSTASAPRREWCALVESVDPSVSADELGGLIDLIADNTISGRIAKDVFSPRAS